MDILSRIVEYIFTVFLLVGFFCPFVTGVVFSGLSLAIVGITQGNKRRWPSWALGMICAGAVQLGYLIVRVLPVVLDSDSWGSSFFLMIVNGRAIYSFVAAFAAFGLATLVTFAIKKIYRAFSAKRNHRPRGRT